MTDLLSKEDFRDLFSRVDECEGFNYTLPTATLYALLQENAQRREAAEKPVAWRPDHDPVTGREFFLWIEHPTLGYVPTYGGPYDSYTLPERDSDGEFVVHRYDHDEGAWVDDEVLSYQVVDDWLPSNQVELDQYVKDNAPPLPVVPDEIDERMKAAGMLSAVQIIEGQPLDAFIKHSGVVDMGTLLQWSEMRRAEFLRMQSQYDLGDKDKTDDMYEWVIAHSAAFSELHINIRAAMLQLSGNSEQVNHSVDATNMGNHPVIPEGWALVPENLTTEMRNAWDSAPMSDDDSQNMRDAYRAMLYSAPQPPAATPTRYMNRFTGMCFTLEQQPGADTDTDVYVPLYERQPGKGE